VYITGEYKSTTLSFGSKSVAKSTARSDVFLAGYNSLGNELWAITSAGVNHISSSTSNDIIMDNQNRIVIVGRIGTQGDNSTYLTFKNDTIWAGKDELGWAQVTGFIARFQTDGTFTDGVTDSVFFETLTLANDDHDNYYLGLARQSVISIGAPSGDFSILKMNSSLQKMWRKEYGSNEGISKCHKIAVNGNNVLATGHYVGAQTNFETDTFYSTAYRNRIYTNVFLVNYDTMGNEKWVQSYGGKLTDEGKVVVPYNDSSMYLVGNHESDSLHFGNHLLRNTNNTGSYHVHVSPDWYWRHPNVYVTQVSYGAVSVKDPNRYNAVIYPNPSSGLIRITGEQQIRGIEVTNSLGVMVLKMNEINQDEATVDLKSQPKGIYFIRVLTNDSYSLSRAIIR
jgi:hypothetical protein